MIMSKIREYTIYFLNLNVNTIYISLSKIKQIYNQNLNKPINKLKSDKTYKNLPEKPYLYWKTEKKGNEKQVKLINNIFDKKVWLNSEYIKKKKSQAQKYVLYTIFFITFIE